MRNYLPCLYAFVASIAFSYIFEMRRWRYILCAGLAGAVSWLVYLLLPGFSEVARCFAATIVVAFLAEIFARNFKIPATVFLVIGIVPLVPGGGLYYTMESLINGDLAMFARKGLQAAEDAGAIAVGCSLVSSGMRLLTTGLRMRRGRLAERDRKAS